MPSTPTELHLVPRRVTGALFAVAALLVAAHALLQTLRLGFGPDRVLGLTALFDLDGERNLPAFFGALLLLLAALVLGIVGAQRRAARAPLAGRWLILSAVFLVLALDESIGMHEWWGLRVGAALGLGAWVHVAWPLMALAALGGTLAFYRPWFAALDRSTRRGVALAAALYVGGALGLELVEAGYWAARGAGTYDTPFTLLTTIEESLEMAGATLFLRVMLQHAARLGLRVRFSAWAERPPAVPYGARDAAELPRAERGSATGTHA